MAPRGGPHEVGRESQRAAPPPTHYWSHWAIRIPFGLCGIFSDAAVCNASYLIEDNAGDPDRQHPWPAHAAEAGRLDRSVVDGLHGFALQRAAGRFLELGWYPFTKRRDIDRRRRHHRLHIE